MKRTYFKTILLFVIMFITLKTTMAHADIRYVAHSSAGCPNTPCYTNIQSAVDAALSATTNDTIEIQSSDTPYQENISISTALTSARSLTINGGETASTVLTGGSTGTIINASNTGASVLTLKIHRITFANSTTAAQVSNSISLTISSCIFHNMSGTAVDLSQLTQTAMVNNNVFYYNNTGINGGTASSSIINNILFGNTNAITGSSAAMSTNDYFSNGDDSTATREGSALTTDPSFVDAANGDFHLLADSPCIDTGDGSVGNDSFDGSDPDIGAYGGPDSDTIPFIVSGLAVTSAAANSITIDWNPNDCYLITTDSILDATHSHGYRVYYGSTTPGQYDGTDAAAGNSPITLDLHGAGNYPPYTLDSLNPSTTTLTSPPTLAQPIPSNQTLTLAWSAVTNATGYKVHYGIASTSEQEIDVGPVLYYSLQGLVNGQTYKIAVSAYSQAVYYIAVTAFDNSGGALTPGEMHESFLSSEVSTDLGSMSESGLSNEVSDYPEALVPYPDLPRKGCFIATAAFDDRNALPVRVLREFRDRYLMSSKPGRAFVRWYYENGPYLAALLNDHPWLKPAVRTALLPAAAGAFFMTRTSSTVKLLFLAAMLGALGWLLRKGRVPRQGGISR